MTEHIQPVDYATPVDDRPPVSVSAARGTFFVSVIPPIVGVLIVLVSLGGNKGTVSMMVGLGMLWLFVGGLMTLGTALVGVFGFAGTYSQSGEVSKARGYYASSAAMAVVSLATALLCFAVGANSIGRYQFTVTNRTNVPIEVTVHCSDGNLTVGALQPAQTIVTASTHHKGALNITVRANGRSATTQVHNYFDEDDAGSEVPVIDVEPSDLP